MIAPIWTRLDNAAIIYPSCRTRRYAAQFRMSVTLGSEVSLRLLNQALTNLMPRFPGFSYTLRGGFFWWYLHRLENKPVAGRDNTMNIFSIKKNGGYMFKVGCSGCTITLDIFHALTDGHGAMTFLMSLTAEYLRLKEGAVIEYGGWVLNPADKASRSELEDSFDSFAGLKGNLDKESSAWHIPGREESYQVLHNIRISLSSSAVAAKAKEHGCTVTELLTSLMIAAMQQTRSLYGEGQNPNLRVEVPVDLRTMFDSDTLRNFSSYVHLGVDVSRGDYSLEQIIEQVKLQKENYIKEAPITARVAANVALEENILVRCIPRFIKKPIINMVNSIKGDRYCTHTLSNIGNIKVPEAMAAYIRDINFTLGRARGRSGACACASFGDRLNLNFTRKIEESIFERYFLGWLDAIGLDASVQFETVAEPRPRRSAPVNIPMQRAHIGWNASTIII